MTSKDTVEITSLLTKLYTLQENVGAKSKTTDAEKQQKAAATAVSMGQGRAGKKAGSRFLELKSTIINRLQDVHKMLEEEAARVAGKTSVAQGNNPKEAIAAQSEIREQIRQLNVEWTELNSLYTNEAKKRRSRFTPEELEVQSALVSKLQAEIDKVKAAQMKGYGRGNGADIATTLNTKALADLDATPIFSGGSAAAPGGGGGWNSSGSGAPGAALTEGQRQQIQQLQERDADFDRELDAIGEGISDLAEIAEMQGEEVRRQNVMLDNLGNRIDSVHDHVTNVNAKMKETLAEVGRSSDKICVDIMCIVSFFDSAFILPSISKVNINLTFL